MNEVINTIIKGRPTSEPDVDYDINLIFVGDSITNFSSYPEKLVAKFTSTPSYSRASDVINMVDVVNNYVNISNEIVSGKRNIVMFQTMHHTTKFTNGSSVYINKFQEFSVLARNDNLEIFVISLHDTKFPISNSEADICRVWLDSNYQNYADVYADSKDDPRLQDHTDTIYVADGIHLTAAGQQVQADIFYELLINYLET